MQDIGSFDFVSPPQTQALAAALSRLSALGAVELRSSTWAVAAPTSGASRVGQGSAPRNNSQKNSRSRGSRDDSSSGASLATLTPHGRRMALLPLSPVWAHTLLLSPQFGCVAEALTCAALLSVEPVLLLPSTSSPSRSYSRNDNHNSNSQEAMGSEKDAARAAAAASHRMFTSPDGDLPTLLNVYNAFWAIEARGKDTNAAVAATKAIVVFKGDGDEDDEDDEEGNDDAKTDSYANRKESPKNDKNQTLGSNADVAARRRWAIAHHVSWRALLRAGQVCALFLIDTSSLLSVV